MANAITYIRNVGKSIGYASVDVLKEKNPVFHDFAETNGELMSDMYKSIKDLKKNIKDLPNKIMESEYGKFGQTYLDNLMSDLKTGKLYNKERKDQYDEEAGNAMLEGLDVDVFDDFGDGGNVNLGSLPISHFMTQYKPSKSNTNQTSFAPYSACFAFRMALPPY